MGRQQYLSRLALGRSAFAEVENDQANAQPPPNDPPAGAYIQRYDSKGRPINPSTDERNTALRNAKNAAIALVGVVERKDNHDRLIDLKYRAIRTAREEMLAEEQDAGETLDLVVTLLSFTNYATETLVRQVQAGLYPPSASFASIISNGLSAIRTAGLQGFFAILFPGAPSAIFHATVRVLLGATLSTGVESLSQWLIRQKLRKRTARRVHRALYFACEALLIGLDVALLPLAYHAYAQRLGIAPAWPILPIWKILLPSNPASIHHFGWHAHLSLPILDRLCSPAALMLLHSTLWREQDAEIPVASQLTRFEFPQHFNAPSWTIISPTPSRDPLGWLLYQGYTLRTHLIRFFGYNLQLTSHRRSTNKYENYRRPWPIPTHTEEISHTENLDNIPEEDISFVPTNYNKGSDSGEGDDDDDDRLQHIHRSTELARLAPKYLSDYLDLAFAKVLMLPLQALVVRSVTQSYIASPLPKTTFALNALPHLYHPFRTSGSDGWSERTGYLSKLGLSLSLHAADSAGVFFVVYALSRWYGRRCFGWGTWGVVGGLVYPSEGEE